MSKQKYIQDLKEIKDLMNKSSKFISLSGWSGISIGIVALTASFIAKYLVDFKLAVYSKTVDMQKLLVDLTMELTITAAITLVVSLVLGFIFTYNKSKRLGQEIWSSQTKVLLINLFIPLAVGGMLCILLLLKGIYVLIAPLTLVFYGLALINASKYTLSEIRGLGILNCVLGLIGVQFVGYGLLLWAIGFGVLHIIYGILMKLKHQ